MPNIIHIPLRYQNRAHNFPQSWTTSARYIVISAVSDAARTIATDAEAWGWRVVYRDPNEPKIKEQWAKYCKMARDRGWFGDLFRIWQHEHGLRILAKDTAIKEATTLGTRSHPTQIIFHGLRSAAVWVREHARTPKAETPRVKRELKQVLKQTRSESDLGSEVEVHDLSFSEILIERLQVLELEGKAREGYVEGFMSVDAGLAGGVGNESKDLGAVEGEEVIGGEDVDDLEAFVKSYCMPRKGSL